MVSENYEKAALEMEATRASPLIALVFMYSFFLFLKHPIPKRYASVAAGLTGRVIGGFFFE